MENLKGKFVIAFDTICDGWQCWTEGEGEDRKPVLYNSSDEAFKEKFDNAYSELSNKTAKELREDHEGVTKSLVKEMGKILDAGDINKMFQFLIDNQECDNDEWIEPADTFMLGRKAIFGNQGLQIIGKKL